MSGQLFKEARYDLGKLTNFIERGVIGLPDIQCPFVWKNTKVRNLFDVVDGYLSNLSSVREVTPDERKQIKQAITKVHSLLTFLLRRCPAEFVR